VAKKVGNVCFAKFGRKSQGGEKRLASAEIIGLSLDLGIFSSRPIQASACSVLRTFRTTNGRE